MMGEKLDIAVIGCGVIAREHLKAIRRIDSLRLVATVDIIEERAETYAAEYGAERCYTSTIEALENPDVDVVSICLPPFLHAEVALEAINRGKHVLTEKPMAVSLGEADEMIEAADRGGVTLMVEQTLRFRSCNVKAKELIKQGRIGEPRNSIRRRLGYSRSFPSAWARIPEQAGGWLLYGFGSHEVDITLWHFDSPAVQVYAQGARNNPYWNDYDEVSIQMRLANGVMSTVHMSLNCQQAAWNSLIIGTAGSMLVKEAKQIELKDEVLETPIRPGEGVEAAFRELIAAIEERREPESSGKSVRKTMWALEAAKLSMHKQRAIDTRDLGEPLPESSSGGGFDIFDGKYRGPRKT